MKITGALLPPLIFPMGGITWVVFFWMSGTRVLLTNILYVCGGCDALHVFDGF